MRKTLLMLLLSTASAGAMAEALSTWVSVVSIGDETAYALPTTIMPHHDSLATMWELHDYKEASRKAPNGGAYASEIRKSEYDCKEPRVRNSSSVYFAEGMGRGRLLDKSGDSEWRPIVARSLDESMQQFVCTKRGR